MKNTVLKPIIIALLCLISLSNIAYSQSNNVNLVGKWLNPNYLKGVFYAGNYAYLFTENVMTISDVSDAEAIIGKSQFVTTENINYIIVNEAYAYIATNNLGMYIVDVSDPSHPIEIGFISTEGNISFICISGNYAYVAAKSAGMRIIDISNPTTPVELGFYNTGNSDANSVSISGNYAFIAYGTDGLQIVDISTPNSPAMIDEMNWTSNMKDVFIIDNLAYITSIDGEYGNNYTLRILDISNILSPVLLGSTSILADINLKLFVSGDYAYITQEDYIDVFDVSNPNSPEYLSYYYCGILSSIYQFHIEGSNAYLPTAEMLSTYSLKILDFTNPLDFVELGKYVMGRFVNDISLKENYIYTFNGMIRIFNISEPAYPELVKTIETAASSGALGSIFIDGNYLYLTATNDGVIIYDISDPAQTYLAGSYYKPISRGIFVKDSYAYICAQQEGIYIVDISNPSSTVEISSLILDGGFKAMQVYVSGNYAYITDDANKLHIVDISIPTTPIETGTLQMTSPPGTSYYIKGNNIYVKGNYAYVTIPFPATGLVIVDISNPESPTIAGIYESGSEFYEVSVIDNYAYVADKSNGLQIIDVSDPTNTAQAGYYYNFTELNFSACVCTDVNHAFLGTQNGLFIFEDDLISNVNPSYNSSSILEIYPNPTNDYISVLINDEYSEFSNICIYDEMGKIIFTSQLKDTKYLINNALDIDISKLTPGVYFVIASAYDSNKTTVKSFVKY